LNFKETQKRNKSIDFSSCDLDLLLPSIENKSNEIDSLLKQIKSNKLLKNDQVREAKQVKASIETTLEMLKKFSKKFREKYKNVNVFFSKIEQLFLDNNECCSKNVLKKLLYSLLYEKIYDRLDIEHKQLKWGRRVKKNLPETIFLFNSVLFCNDIGLLDKFRDVLLCKIIVSKIAQPNFNIDSFLGREYEGCPSMYSCLYKYNFDKNVNFLNDCSVEKEIHDSCEKMFSKMLPWRFCLSSVTNMYDYVDNLFEESEKYRKSDFRSIMQQKLKGGVFVPKEVCFPYLEVLLKQVNAKIKELFKPDTFKKVRGVFTKAI
jgi:hypothetical protein